MLIEEFLVIENVIMHVLLVYHAINNFYTHTHRPTYNNCCMERLCNSNNYLVAALNSCDKVTGKYEHHGGMHSIHTCKTSCIDISCFIFIIHINHAMMTLHSEKNVSYLLVYIYS